MKLTIELVPNGSWFTNLRSALPATRWNKIRRDCYRKAGYVCEVCGGKGPKHPVECHEIWHYDDKRKIQRLDGTIALCPACHEVKHIGLAQIRGRLYPAVAHMAKVNGWKGTEGHRRAMEEVSCAFDKWRERSLHKWEIDISWLDNTAGVVVESQASEDSERGET